MKARNRLPDELRRPLMLMAVARNSLEDGADGNVWVNTDMDEEDVSVTAERTVVLNSPEHNGFA